MSRRFNRRFFYSVSTVTLTALMAHSVHAEDAAATDSKPLVLAPIVITGEKLERDLQKTATSVTIITGKDIAKEKTGDTSVTEVLKDVPNVVYSDSVGAPIIRGQDTQGPNNGQNVFWGGTVPRATINLDGHYLNYNEYFFGATSVWDLDNIEVFRGPQTTSQGANAIAGAIVVNTKDPTFTPEAAYQAEIGNYNAKRASFMLSGPIYKDELAARLAVDYSGRDTFIDYINPAFQHGDTNQDFRALNARFKMLWQPAELSGFEAKLTYSYNNTNRPTQEAASAPFGDLEHTTTTMPTWKQHTSTGILDLSYELDNGIKLFNQTQYSTSSVNRITGVINNGDADVDQTNISNESRVNFGSQDDVISGVAGIFYAHTKSDEALYLRGISAFDDKKDNIGVFTEVSYKLTDQWTATGGLRYQQDKIRRNGTSVMATAPVNYDETFSAVLPKLSLAYDVTPDLTFGGLINRGYNPGGVSLYINPAATVSRWQPFKEETLWNYELFTRAKLLDDRLTVNGNVFYMDMKNTQYNIPVEVSTGVFQSYTINAEKTHSYGMELGLDYQALDNLTLKTSAGILRTKIDTISNNAAYEGNEFAKSPGYMLSIGASWDVTDKFNVSGQVRHVDGYFSDIANTPTFWIKPYTVADARMSYAFTEQVELYGFVKNIFNERAPTYMQTNRGIGGVEASMTLPRMFGVGIKGSF